MACLNSHLFFFYNKIIGPWWHVTLFVAGCWAGNALPEYEKKLVEEINEMRKELGLAPMVGTHSYIGYRTPESMGLPKELPKEPTEEEVMGIRPLRSK